MDSCKKYIKLITGYLSAEISPSDKNKLEAHAADCPQCRELMKLNDKLDAMQPQITYPSEQEFRQQRQQVMRIIRNRESAENITWTEQIAAIFKRPAFAYAVAGLLLVSGFSVGRLTTGTAEKGNPALIQQISYTAQQNQNLQEVSNSPYFYSNVKIKQSTGDQVALSFDVSTHLEIERPKTDPLVHEVLAQSLLNPATTGARLNSIAYSKNIKNPIIQEALILTMLNDPETAVRMKALQSLTAYPINQKLETAFLNILHDEKSVEMRLAAIDYLTNSEIDRTVLSQQIEQSGIKNKTPDYMEAVDYLDPGQPLEKKLH